LVGAVAIAKEDHPNLILSDKTLRLNLKLDLKDPVYLMYWLRTKDARQHLESHATGTSGSMRNISQENIRSTPIPLPSIAEQRRIAAILDRADAVRRKRQEAIALTEELLRSAFLEMFGDPITNPKKWKKVSLANAVDLINGRAFSLLIGLQLGYQT
jgi:type I restriction enzyme, S subunit